MTVSLDQAQPGDRLGPYRLLRVIGEGGMGRVFLAEQSEPVQREVAIKFLTRRLDSETARAWFELERQALAEMHHPAIAQVYDAGTTPSGQPYFVMEYVDGLTLSNYCRQSGLGLRERVALFIRVCQGVQHAHQKGVIHRDLKPGNVLVQTVDGVALPRIIDFGVALRGEQAEAGLERAGTLAYMSPEQAGWVGGGIDTRSDVYSLGVMLYELLTSQVALPSSFFDSRSHRRLHEHQQAAALALHTTMAARTQRGAPDLLSGTTENPPVPERLPWELEAVLARALKVDRAERWESAAAFADDLRRWLDREPVRALPATRWYLLRCFARRNALMLGSAVIVVLALGGGLGAALFALEEARTQRGRAELAAREAREQADVARQTSQFLADVFGGVDPERARGADTRLLRAILDDAAKQSERQLATQPNVALPVLDTLAQSYLSLGLAVEALPLAERAVATAQRALPVSHSARCQADLRLANVLLELGRHDEARVLGEQLSGSECARQDAVFAAHALSMRGRVARAQGAFEAALELFGKALEIQRTELGADAKPSIDTLYSIGVLRSDLGRHEAAAEAYVEALERYARALGEDHPASLPVHNSLAILHLDRKRFAEAEAVLRPALSRHERIYGKEHPATLRVVSNLAGALRQQGRIEESGPFYERTLAGSISLYGEAHPMVVVARSNLGNFLRDAGRLEESLQAHERACSDAVTAFGERHPNRAIFLDAWAQALERAGRLQRAMEVFAQAYDIAREGFGDSHTRSCDIAERAHALYQRAGNAADTEVWNQRARQCN